MIERKMLGEFIYQQRRAKNLSQTELGELVGVSNKAVSKWETDEANPDIKILPRLAEVLGVTTDELLACEKRVTTENSTQAKETVEQNNQDSYIEIESINVAGITNRGKGYYEFISNKKTKKGTPYLHINIGKDERGKIRQAKGIISVGIIAKGVFSLGVFSLGIVSCGAVSIGLFAAGAIALGLLIAIGAIGIGIGISVGGIVIGTIAVGGIAIGVLSVGGLSIGVWAHTSLYGQAVGLHTYYHKLITLIF